MNTNGKIEFSQKQIETLESYLKTEIRSDASPSIRGFVFQDLLAIRELFENKDDGYVLCECVEDVCYYGENSSLKVLQAKYYKSHITDDSLCGISANLFYDYLSLRDAFSNLSFCICTKLDNIKKLPEYESVKEWIIKNKDDKPKFKRTRTAFNSATESEYKQFTDLYNPDYFGTIDQLIMCTSKLLADYFKKNITEIDYSLYPTDSLKRILLSLAHQRILDSIDYEIPKSSPKINKRKISKSDIVDYCKSALSNNNKLPLNTLLAIIDDIYIKIFINNEELQEKENCELATTLKIVYQKTKKWISNLFDTDEGQMAFIRTVTKMSADECEEWPSLSLREKADSLLKQFDGMRTFFGYLWKIIIDVYFENGKIEKYLEIELYLDTTKGYIRFLFNSKNGVILPAVTDGTIRDDTYNYLERIRKFAPQIWYMNYHPENRQLSSYNWSTIDVSTDPGVSNITEIDEDSAFYIECMRCINIGRGGWISKEQCNDCIFSDTCKYERKSKWPEI